MNTELKLEEKPDGYTQVLIWEGVELPDTKEFETKVGEFVRAKIKLLGSIITSPTTVNGIPEPNTGGRIDLVFSVHDSDNTPMFAMRRLEMGMRWLEDVLNNDNYYNPAQVSLLTKYRSW